LLSLLIAAMISSVSVSRAGDFKRKHDENESTVHASGSPREIQSKKGFPFCKGVNYVSWTTGDYPYTTAWKRQTYRDSQGITKAAITSNNPFRGVGSLELTLNILGKTKTHRNGEVFVDLRYMPSYDALYPIKIRKNADVRPLGIDLSRKTVGAVVFCGKGTGGNRLGPNGIQLFMKSVKIKDGKEVWSAFYGNWHNIWREERDSRNTRSSRSKARQLGDVRECKWSFVSMRVPESAAGVKAPPYGYADSDFDPGNVALIGLKFGLNRNNTADITGKIWVDNLGWKDIVCKGDATFEFWKVNHPHGVKIWEYFGSSPSFPIKFDEGLIFKKSGIFVCTGNSVFFDYEDVEDPVTSLQRNGFNAVAIVNTEYMDNANSTEIGPVQRKSHTPREMTALIKEIHSKGMRVMLKPHVDLKNDEWRGTIRPPQNATKEQKDQWFDAWFKSYTRFITGYAEMAEAHGVEMLAIGTEFKSLIGRKHSARWKKVIRKVRDVYSGLITYAANWDNYENVCLWDMVDFVGIDAYFPSGMKRNPSLEELKMGWSNFTYKGRKRNWIRELEKWQATVGKPVLFTEIGYRSTDYSARRPWEYKEQRSRNLRLQARCYRAVLEAFRDKPWFKGVFFWLWSPKMDAGGKFDTGFTPQGKSAQSVFSTFRGR